MSRRSRLKSKSKMCKNRQIVFTCFASMSVYLCARVCVCVGRLVLSPSDGICSIPTSSCAFVCPYQDRANQQAALLLCWPFTKDLPCKLFN